MAIDKKLISFATRANFVTQLANSQILNSSIVFIQDTQEIWTHGIFFDCKIRYPSTFAWASGTTSGPTGTLSGTGISNISFGAIPSASATNSGVVTTGTQTFAGAKTFNSSVTCQAFSGTTGSFSDTMTAKSFTISDTNAISHITFSRASYNYFTSPVGGNFSFIPNGKAITGSTPDLIISDATVFPGTNNYTKLGTTTYRWSELNSVSGNFSGNVAITGTVTGTWNGGVVGVTYGGTGKNSVSINNMLYASSANTYSEVATSAFGRGLLNSSSNAIISGLYSEYSNYLVYTALPRNGGTIPKYFKLMTFTSTGQWSGVDMKISVSDGESANCNAILYIHYRFSDVALTNPSAITLTWQGNPGAMDGYLQYESAGIITLWLKTSLSYSSLKYTILQYAPIGTTSIVKNSTAADVLSGTTIRSSSIDNIAHKLATPRAINGVNFDGTSAITVNTPNTLSIGSYLTGSNFNGSAATTWAVDATSVNTASKIVARDSSGNFSAGSITADLVGSADKLDGLHSTAFSQEFHYGTTAQNTGYYKININSTATWMLQFTIRLYQSYNYYDIVVSGYQYGANYWYNPRVSLLTASGDSIVVTFGYDSANNLWIAVPANHYTGLTICNINNGHTQVSDWSGKFTVTNQAVLTGTVQTTVTAKRPLIYDEVATSATTLQTARTINGTSFNGSANITTANWGTARTLTIGSTGKLVDGSNNASWSLAEIGALSLADGGTINGAITINNYQYQKWNLYVGAKTSYNDANNGIVLSASGAMDITGAEPYIDLHYGNTTTEYTTRLIEYGNGVFSIANGKGLYLGSTFVSSLSYRLYVAGTQYNEGNITTNGELNLGATTAANAVLKLNNKIAIQGYDSWLRINDIGAFNGIYCGRSVFRTDGEFQVGSSGQFFKVTTAGNVTAKNLTLDGSLTGVTTANFGNAVTALGTMSIGTTNLGYYGTNSGSITNTQFCVSPYLDKYQVAFGSSTSQSWTFVQNNTNNKPIAYAAINAQMLSNVAGAETGILRFFIKPSALGGTEAARLTDQSNFLIGYTTEQGARLAVNGLINSTSLYCTSNLYIRTTSLTYRDTNTGTNSANVPFIISGYSGKYQAVDAGSSSQSWNFIQDNSASNRIRYATINAQMVSSTAGTETGVLRFYTKPASGAIAEALRIDENQRTLVGYSSNPGTYKFAVNGTSYFNGAVTTTSSITCSSISTNTIGADSYSITGGSVLTCPNNKYVVPTVIWHGKVDCVTNPIITKFQGISELSVLKYATGKYDFSFDYAYHVPATKDFYQVIITPRGRDTGEVNMIWGMCADNTKTRDSFQLKLADDASGFNDGYLEIMIIEVSSSIITS